MSYTYPTVGEYVISVYAEMESTDEIVNDSYTLNVVPTGITFNKKSLRRKYYETVLLTHAVTCVCLVRVCVLIK